MDTSPISTVTTWYFQTVIALWNFIVGYGWIFASIVAIPITRKIARYLKSIIR